ncbi:MAG: acetate--CoA ligase family protein [Pseudomonadota bacterium]
MKKQKDLTSLFEPRGVAIIGASHDPEKIGYQIVDNIVKGGFEGGIYPVNLKGGKVAGIPAYTSIHDVIHDIDIAILAIPAVHVLDSVKICTKKNISNVVIITSGFSEIGNIAEERKIVEIAKAANMRVLGPNIFGLYSSKVKLNATFGPPDIRPGHVSIITQSGAIGVAMIGKTKVENIGLANIISVGNKSDIDEVDLLEYLIADVNTRAILMYLEGVRGGRKLVDILKSAALKKPVVVIKAGRSARGASAAASHTGSLAGTDEVFDDIVKQCGVIRAETIDEALRLCRFLAGTQTPDGQNTVIITNGGGVGVMAADACEKFGLQLYDDQVDLEKTFEKTVPKFGSFKNPVDITGSGSAKTYDQALTAALKNSNINSVICLGCETASFDAKKFADTIAKQYKAYENNKPITFSLFGGEQIELEIMELRKSGLPIYHDVYDAVSCLGALNSFHQNKLLAQDLPIEVEINKGEIQNIINSAKSHKRSFLLAYEAKRIMELIEVSTPVSAIARNLRQAVETAGKIGFPVAMKVVSKDIIHKSDAGGLALDLENKQEILEAYESILHNCKKFVPHAHIEGVEIAEMIKPGLETIVGARRDPSFGPIVMFGMGGIYVEVMKDVAFRAFPLSRAEIMKMISELRFYPMLLGVRGESEKDLETIISTIIKVGAIITCCPEIADIEINPLVVYDKGEGAKAVDVRILLSTSQETV